MRGEDFVWPQGMQLQPGLTEGRFARGACNRSRAKDLILLMGVAGLKRQSRILLGHHLAAEPAVP